MDETSQGDQKPKTTISRGRRLLVVAGLLFVVAAIGLLGQRVALSFFVGKSTQGVLDQLNDQMPESYVAWSIPKIRPKDTSMATKSVQGYDFIGTLAIPTLDIELPVNATLDGDRLALSPCCYEGSYVTDDLIICGEGYATHFGNISTVGIKDEVRLASVDGVMHRYIVSNVETIRLEDIDKIYDDWDLALFTFNADGTVLVVRCIRVT